MSSFVNDVFRVATSNVMIILFGFATSVITARYIGPEGNGIISGLTVYPTLFMSIGALGIRQSTTYFIGKEIYPEHKIKTAITQIWSFTTVISLVVCFFLMTYFSKSGTNSFWVVLALLPIPLNLFITYNSGIFLGKNDIKTFNKVNWIPPFISLLLILLLIVCMRLGVTGALIAPIGGALFMAILMLLKNNFIKAFSMKYDFGIIKSMLSLGIVYAVALLVINLNYKVDLILLDRLSDSYELGIYAKGASLTQYLWQIPMVFSTIVFARSANSKTDRAFSYKVVQLLRLSFIAIFIVSLVLFVFSDFIIVALYGEAFEGSVFVQKLLLPGVLILTIFKVMNVDLQGKGKPWVAMKAMVPSLIINIVLNVILIPDYGALGSAMSSTISYTFAGLTFLYFYSRETQMPVKEIISFKKSDFDPVVSLVKKIKNKRTHH